MSTEICKTSICATVVVITMLCSCHRLRSEGDDMDPGDKIDRGYKVASNYVKLNYEWEPIDYCISYNSPSKDLLVYEAIHRDDIVNGIIGHEKSVVVWVCPTTFKVFRASKSKDVPSRYDALKLDKGRPSVVEYIVANFDWEYDEFLIGHEFIYEGRWGYEILHRSCFWGRNVVNESRFLLVDTNSLEVVSDLDYSWEYFWNWSEDYYLETEQGKERL